MSLNLKFSGVLALLLGGRSWIMIQQQEKAIERLKKAESKTMFPDSSPSI